ncbi:MAG: helix-turn-helix transcriptional regulator [Hyphomicrobiaceae bacterium]|nr:helix-turn-helix transcriptional regulator [Hyphomicrobiaceae bacterium]
MDAVVTSTKLGERIRKERKQQVLTQEELAAPAGVGVRFVRELEHGKENRRIGLALQVLQTLRLSLAVFGRGEAP